MTTENTQIEIKVQTVYYENVTGKIVKYYHANGKRISMKQAHEILEEQGIHTNLILRVLIERVKISLSREELEQKITESERFYQQEREQEQEQTEEQ